MSWSLSCIGKPTAVLEYLNHTESGLTGSSLEEFRGVKPHIEALIKANFTKLEGIDDPTIIELDASGHNYQSDKQSGGDCSVNVRKFHRRLV